MADPMTTGRNILLLSHSAMFVVQRNLSQSASRRPYDGCVATRDELRRERLLKLSDAAGLEFFPLLLTAASDCMVGTYRAPAVLI